MDLKPLLGELDRDENIHRLRIAPDGLLTLLPFAALSIAPRQPLIERFAISYVSAGRDIAAPSSNAAPLNPPTIALSPGKQTRLSGASEEARALQALIPRAQLLGETQATEQRIKDLQRPALLHIVGHGMVRAAEDSLPGVDLPEIDAGARAMGLSTIVLEEAYGRGGGSTQDGLLTALELESLNLDGTEMLVLSQCRMADGVPSSGDGVYGMRRAAAIAGAKTFVAPLWNVSDQTERALMERFYAELRTGHGRSDALRGHASAHARTAIEKLPLLGCGDPHGRPIATATKFVRTIAVPLPARDAFPMTVFASFSRKAPYRSCGLSKKAKGNTPLTHGARRLHTKPATKIGRWLLLRGPARGVVP
jgi:CHAT domain-containing protein